MSLTAYAARAIVVSFARRQIWTWRDPDGRRHWRWYRA